MANAGNSTGIPNAPTPNWNLPLYAPQRKSTFYLIFLKGQPRSLGYVISGSLSVATENVESRCLVGASLGLNIISAIVSSVEFVILIIDAVMNGNYTCDVSCSTIWLVRESIFISLIIASLLQLCVSISISSFGCSSVIENSVSQQQVFVIQNDVPARNIHPTSPHLGVHPSAPVTLIPQYPICYENQKSINIPSHNPNMALQPH
ncbi:membrane-spanning 4-domains subfamily A member 12-like [Mixophyes fleayi]|uniref:membrane-spanning 4-domains subfamily A member 12-like n=1 Tax=Mixophyes fleayi TaxID=3061075 RepID=UPI003F4E3E4F